MKKITALFVFCTLTIATVFVACQKENTTSVTSEQQTTNTSANDRVYGGCIPIGPFSFQIPGYTGCAPGFGICNDPWFPFPGGPYGPLESNQAMGAAAVDAEGYLVFHIDGSTLGESFLEGINQNPTFTIGAPQVLPQDFVNQVYACSGFPVPEGPLVIAPGTYPVELDMTAAAAAGPRPWWMLVNVDVEVKWKRNADGSEELTIKVHCC